MSVPGVGAGLAPLAGSLSPVSGRRVPFGAVAGRVLLRGAEDNHRAPVGSPAMDLPSLHPHPEGVIVDVWVVPGARKDEIAGLHDGRWRIRVTAPPEGGRANRAVCRVVAAGLGVRRAEVHTGHGSRRKQVLVPGLSVPEAAERLRRRG